MGNIWNHQTKMLEECKEAKQTKSIFGLLIQTIIYTLIGEIIMIAFYSVFAQVNLLEEELVVTDTTQLMHLFGTIFTILVFLTIGKHQYHRSWRSLGLTKHHAIPQYFLGLGIGFVMISSVIGLAYLFNGLSFSGMTHGSVKILIMYFIAFMIQGFSEELMTRGFFMNACAVKTGVKKAVIYNSLMFAMLHLANDGISIIALINLILIGIIFSLFSIYFDNIIVSSAIHSIWNFAQGNIYGVLVSGIYLPSTWMRFSIVQGNDLISGGAFGLEGSILVTIMAVFIMVLLSVLYKRKQERAV